MSKTTMNVSLTPELEGHIQAFVQKGLYGNQSEVVRAALRLLLEKEEEREAKLAALRSEIDRGLTDVLNGEATEVTAEEFKARGRRRLASLTASS